MSEIGEVQAKSKYVCAKCGEFVDFFDLYSTKDGVLLCEEHFRRWEKDGYDMFFESEDEK